jgi:hypothetical protein
VNPRQAGSINQWDIELGPFYLVKSVADWTGLSPASVRRRIAGRQLLGLKTIDRRWILPSFQFDEHGVVPARLAEVMAAMDPGNDDPWGSAALLRELADVLDDRSPIEALRDGDVDRVLALALQYGEPLRELFPGPSELDSLGVRSGETVRRSKAQTTGRLPMAQLMVNRVPMPHAVQEETSEESSPMNAEFSRDEAGPRPTLYLDVDGCFCPFGTPDIEWGDIASATVRLDDGAEFYVQWAPGLVIALDDLRTRYGLELVWLTTWNIGDAAR